MIEKEIQPLTSATRQVRLLWFSVGGSPLNFLVLPGQEIARSPPLRVVCREAEHRQEQSFACCN